MCVCIYSCADAHTHYPKPRQTSNTHTFPLSHIGVYQMTQELSLSRARSLSRSLPLSLPPSSLSLSLPLSLIRIYAHMDTQLGWTVEVDERLKEVAVSCLSCANL